MGIIIGPVNIDNGKVEGEEVEAGYRVEQVEEDNNKVVGPCVDSRTGELPHTVGELSVKGLQQQDNFIVEKSACGLVRLEFINQAAIALDIIVDSEVVSLRVVDHASLIAALVKQVVYLIN